MANPLIQKVSTSDLTWFNIIGTSKKELDFIAKIIPTVDPLDLRDIPPPTQRPKLIVRADYIFLILNPLFSSKLKHLFLANSLYFRLTQTLKLREIS